MVHLAAQSTTSVAGIAHVGGQPNGRRHAAGHQRSRASDSTRRASHRACASVVPAASRYVVCPRSARAGIDMEVVMGRSELSRRGFLTLASAAAGAAAILPRPLQAATVQGGDAE